MILLAKASVFKRHGLVFLLFFGFGLSTFAQTINVTGKVSDEKNEPLPGVSVKVLNTNNGVSTDDKGMYHIKVNADAVLEFSMVGYTSQQVKVTATQPLNITLQAQPKGLNEVVVIGYGATTKGDLVGSVASVKADDIRKTAPTVQEALQGKVTGVQVSSNSGEPGAGINLSIRGTNTVNAGSDPLYIIDGLQIDVNTGEVGGNRFGANVRYNPLSTINPSDIKSIEILKDAAATAIFGSRGANGVIIVTTKQGGGDATSVEVDAYNGISTVIKKLDVLNGQDFANYRMLIQPSSIYGTDTNNDGIADKVKDFSNEQINWQDEILHTAYTQSYNIGLNSGANSKVRVSSSFGFLNQQGIVDKNSFKRFSGRTRVEYPVTSKLNIGGGINYTRTISDGVTATSGGGQYYGVIESFVLFRPLTIPESDEAGNPDNGGLTNPRIFLNEAYKNIPSNRMFFDGFANYRLKDNLILRIGGGGMLSNTKGREWYPSTTSWGFSRNGMALLNEIEANSWQTSNTLTWFKNLKGGHYFNAVLGFELNYYQFSNLSTRAESFENQRFNPIYDLGQAAVFPENTQTSFWDTSRESEFARLNYVYKDRYLFTGSLRRDGSSKFGANNKYAWFPAAGLAWKIHNENFLKKYKAIDELKLRVSYGKSGNDRIDAYRSLSKTDKAYYANSGGNSDLGLAPSEIENPNLKWETTSQVNLGLDLLFFNKRLGFTIDWYKKWTKDMLLQADVASQTGSYRQWQNIGQVNNNGLELGLNTINIAKPNFEWSTNFNISLNRNKVVSLGGGSPIPVSIPGGHIIEVGRVLVGQPIGSGWGYVFDGVYQTSDFNPDGSLKAGVPSFNGYTVKPGDLKFKDLTGDGKVNPTDDKTVISTSIPKHTGGFTNSFKYKAFDLGVFFQWSYGNDVMNLGRYRYEGYIPYYNLSTAYYNNRWTAQNPSNEYPAIGANGKTESSSYYVEDGSFLRLKSLNLGYTLPSAVTKKLKINNLRIYLNADNLITWTKYSGYDPEVSFWNPLITGVDYLVYPRPRTYTLGLNVKL